MDQQATSPFQLLNWRIHAFNIQNDLILLREDTEIQWSITLRKAQEYQAEGQEYIGMLGIQFSFRAEQDERTITCSGESIGVYSFRAEESDENTEKLDRLLSTNAAYFNLSHLRSTLLLHLPPFITGAKQVVLPQVNMAQVRFDEPFDLKG